MVCSEKVDVLRAIDAREPFTDSDLIPGSMVGVSLSVFLKQRACEEQTHLMESILDDSENSDSVGLEYEPWTVVEVRTGVRYELLVDWYCAECPMPPIWPENEGFDASMAIVGGQLRLAAGPQVVWDKEAPLAEGKGRV